MLQLYILLLLISLTNTHIKRDNIPHDKKVYFGLMIRNSTITFLVAQLLYNQCLSDNQALTHLHLRENNHKQLIFLLAWGIYTLKKYFMVFNKIFIKSVFKVGDSKNYILMIKFCLIKYTSLSIIQSRTMFVCLFVCLSVCLFVWLSVCSERSR